MRKNNLKKIMVSMVTIIATLSIPTYANAEWVKQDKHTLYNQDGKYLTGWQYIDNNWYYFSENGYRAYDGYLNIEGNHYYFDIDGRLTESRKVIQNINSITLDNVKNVSDLEKYLNTKYSTLETPIGTLKFKFDVNENDDRIFEYDFEIETDYGTIENDKYNLNVFEPYDLENSIKINNEDKEKTIELLKKFQKNIAKDSIKAFPNKKIKGGFYTDGYEYQYIRVGYYSIDFLSWTNYSEIDKDYYDFDNYQNTEITEFHWDDDYDDYDFTD